MNSCKLSIQSGILPGGGVALLKSIQVLDLVHFDNHSQSVAKDILVKVLKQPLIQLLRNASLEYDTIVHNIQNNQNVYYGYDLKNHQFGDLIEMGVIDSFGTVKSILDDSFSVAGMVLTTEVIIYNDTAYSSTRLNKYQKKPF